MALERGRYGLEYDTRQRKNRSSGLGWVFAVAALAAFVTLCWTLVRRVRAGREEAALTSREDVVEDLLQLTPSGSPPAAASETSRVFQSFQPLNADLTRRPPKVRNLLMRLEEAERRRDVEMAVSTIETLRALPGSPVADIDDTLARRLGALNLQCLFGLRSAQWVKKVRIGRGDSASRIAAEHGSTLASLSRLNGGNVEKLVAGKSLYVMNHPRFVLVIHRRTQTADLSLNGKFFKRYDLRAPVKAREGTYEMPERRRLFWEGIGSAFGPEDRKELDLLLPKAMPILVSEL
ncbi:MAG: LysM peptidoglycan-binding domain-containing protein [Kiritimatiellia bacterium]